MLESPERETSTWCYPLKVVQKKQKSGPTVRHRVPNVLADFGSGGLRDVVLLLKWSLCLKSISVLRSPLVDTGCEVHGMHCRCP